MNALLGCAICGGAVAAAALAIRLPTQHSAEVRVVALPAVVHAGPGGARLLIGAAAAFAPGPTSILAAADDEEPEADPPIAAPEPTAESAPVRDAVPQPDGSHAPPPFAASKPMAEMPPVPEPTPRSDADPSPPAQERAAQPDQMPVPPSAPTAIMTEGSDQALPNAVVAEPKPAPEAAPDRFPIPPASPPTVLAEDPKPAPEAASIAPDRSSAPPTAAPSAVAEDPKQKPEAVPISPDRAPVPPAVPPTAVPAASPELLERLLRRGEDLLRIGDISGARLLFERAATLGSVPAARRAGETYDADFLRRAGVRGVPADPAKAREWYARAARGGDQTARTYLEAGQH